MKPRLLRSGMTGTVYVVTRYREVPSTFPGGPPVISANTKYDVTDDFQALVRDDALFIRQTGCEAGYPEVTAALDRLLGLNADSRCPDSLCVRERGHEGDHAFQPLDANRESGKP